MLLFYSLRKLFKNQKTTKRLNQFDSQFIRKMKLRLIDFAVCRFSSKLRCTVKFFFPIFQIFSLRLKKELIREYDVKKLGKVLKWNSASFLFEDEIQSRLLIYRKSKRGTGASVCKCGDFIHAINVRYKIFLKFNQVHNRYTQIMFGCLGINWALNFCFDLKKCTSELKNNS